MSGSFLAAALAISTTALLSQQGGNAGKYGLTALTDGSGFVQIRPGEFLMGSTNGNADEQPVRRVRITRGFQMGKFEVTQAQWDAIMSSAHPVVDNPGTSPPQKTEWNPSHFKGPELPVEKVSWPVVQQFIAALNARDKSHEYRLPTEAEWEYACRAGTTGEYAGPVDEMAWYEANADGQTHPVGQKKPNAWGLYDMHGNVWEWVEDWYGIEGYDPASSTDPRGPSGPGSYRVYRGGAWTRSASDNRSAFRGFDFPNDGYYNVGFRLARTPR